MTKNSRPLSTSRRGNISKRVPFGRVLRVAKEMVNGKLVEKHYHSTRGVKTYKI